MAACQWSKSRAATAAPESAAKRTRLRQPGKACRISGVRAGFASAAVIAAFQFKPAVGFLGAWLFVTLAPTSSIVPIATEVGAERRVYLPLAAVVVLTVAGVPALWRRTGAGRAAALGLGTVALIAVFLAGTTIARDREFHSGLTLAHAGMARWPNARTEHWLRELLVEAGRHDEGVAALRLALAGPLNSTRRLDAPSRSTRGTRVRGVTWRSLSSTSINSRRPFRRRAPARSAV